MLNTKMLNTNVVDTLEDIKRWAEAYEILRKWNEQQSYNCNDCSRCGFNTCCNEATNLMRR